MGTVGFDAIARNEDLQVAVNLVKDVVAQIGRCGGIASDAAELVALGEDSVSQG